MTARYAQGNDEARYRKLLEELSGFQYEERTARFRTVIAIYDPEREMVRTCEGVFEGHIVGEPRGSGGFGYDPVFYSDELGKTGGEMTVAEKNTVSHRGKALIKARELLLAEFA